MIKRQMPTKASNMNDGKIQEWYGYQRYYPLCNKYISRGGNYRPQTKLGKVMVLHLSISHTVHGGHGIGGICDKGEGGRGEGGCAW